MLDALPGNLALWRWHAATDKFWATDRFRAIVGAPEAAPLSLEVIRNCIHPDDRSSFEQVFTGAHDDAGALHDFRMCAATAADSARSLVCKVRVWRNFKGRAQRASGVIIDVSEHTRFEAESESQRLQLAHLTRVAILGHLSGALAHELNQPLTSILSNAQAAQRFLDEDPVDLAEVRAILEDIVNDDRRASEVIRRLRGMLRPGGTHMQQLDLPHVIREALALANSELVVRRIDVKLHMTPGLPAVSGDRVQIQQVLLNLLLNASDAMSASAVRDRVIDIGAGVDDGMVHITLTDRGPGLEEGQLERVFDAFYTTKREGLGLGLVISRSIVSAHGGRMWATNGDGPGSTEGHGSTFHFTLPVFAPARL